jgi:hypothetical protein
VLGRVDPEAPDPELVQIDQVVGELVAHVVRAGVEILEPEELAVLHVGGVAVVGDRARRVEVVGDVRHAREVAGAPPVVPGARARPRAGRHVVDHSVDIDRHPDGSAPAHHVGELVAGAAAAPIEAIADGLISHPPRVRRAVSARDPGVLVRR